MGWKGVAATIVDCGPGAAPAVFVGEFSCLVPEDIAAGGAWYCACADGTCELVPVGMLVELSCALKLCGAGRRPELPGGLLARSLLSPRPL
jgi:hypothetical protein